MPRTNGKRTDGIATIIQPRFPYLKPISKFQIIQYKIGRQKMIEKLQVMYDLFEDYLDILEQPVIRPTTEPYELVDYYYSIIEELCVVQEIEQNIIPFFEDFPDSYETNKETIKFSTSIPCDQFRAFGIGWLNKIHPCYKTHLLHIFQYLKNQFGINTVWEMLRDEIANFEEYDDHYITSIKDQDPEEYEEIIAQKKEFEAGKLIEMAKEPDLNSESLVELPILKKPKNKLEGLIVDCINIGQQMITQTKGLSISCFYNTDKAHNDGMLGLESVYLIMDNCMYPTDFVEHNVFTNYIDIHANEVGIADYEITKYNFDSTEFNFKPIEILNLFHDKFSDIERIMHPYEP